MRLGLTYSYFITQATLFYPRSFSPEVLLNKVCVLKNANVVHKTDQKYSNVVAVAL